MVLAAKSDPDAADALISQYMGFIRAEAKKLSFGDGEDESSAPRRRSSALATARTS